jgi:hypothetical protein
MIYDYDVFCTALAKRMVIRAVNYPDNGYPNTQILSVPG